MSEGNETHQTSVRFRDWPLIERAYRAYARSQGTAPNASQWINRVVLRAAAEELGEPGPGTQGGGA